MSITEGVLPIPGAPKHLGDGSRDRRRIHACNQISADLDRFWSFGILSKRHAGYMQDASFLLNPAAICERKAGGGEQTQEIEVSRRLHKLQPGNPFQPPQLTEKFQSIFRPRMDDESSGKHKLFRYGI